MKRRSAFSSIRLATMALVTLFFLANHSHAEIIEFEFDGLGGAGILASSEPGDTGSGSGGLLSLMTFDTDSNELFINVGWGSGNGFVDLSSNVNLLNIHGPTTDGAPDSYGQSGDALMTLPGIDPSPTSGGFSGTVVIPDGNVGDLFSGRLYLHIHSDTFGGGEARGYFIPANAIPEPTTGCLLMFAGLVVIGRRKR